MEHKIKSVAELVSLVESKRETIQVEVDSSKLVPSVDIIDNKRVLVLEYEGTRYPCMERGWTSWASKVLTPKDGQERDEETGRAKRWSIGTIRKFLEMTPTSVTNDVVKAWWKRHEPEPWSIVKYVDNGSPGAIRYIGTDRYRLYRNREFLADLSVSDLGGLVVRNAYVGEDNLILRLTSSEPLPIEGKNIFSGFHLLNSENGSSSIQVRHLIYDLICTNGMMVVFESNDIIRQRHSRFDVEAFRGKVVDVASQLPEIHSESTRYVADLHATQLDEADLKASLLLYENNYDVSKKLVDAVSSKVLNRGTATLWQVVSAITAAAQSYAWQSRMDIENSAASLARDVRDNKHVKYLGM